MSPAEQTNSVPEQPQDLREAIAFFEQMLQTMPEDRVSLEVLAQAYEQAGEPERVRELLLRLASVVVREQDREAAEPLRARLQPLLDEPGVGQAVKRLENLLAAGPKATPQAGTAPGPEATAADALRLVTAPAERRAVMTQELDFAWLLHEQQQLTEDQYASVVADLTDLSTNAKPTTLSVLHLFHSRQFPHLDRLLAFTAERSGRPLLPIESFYPQSSAYGLLPIEYMLVKGVIPFETMGNDLLVAVLNPLSERLLKELETLTGQRCHFFLMQPAGFDLVLEKIRKSQPGAQA